MYQTETHCVTTSRYRYSIIMQQLTADWMSYASNLPLATLHNMSASIIPCNYAFSSQHYQKWLILMFSQLHQVSNCAYIAIFATIVHTKYAHTKKCSKQKTKKKFPVLSFFLFGDSAFNSIQNCKINLRKIWYIKCITNLAHGFQ